MNGILGGSSSWGTAKEQKSCFFCIHRGTRHRSRTYKFVTKLHGERGECSLKASLAGEAIARFPYICQGLEEFGTLQWLLRGCLEVM